MEKLSKIYVAGHRGLVGSAIWSRLQAGGYTSLVGRTHAELDLTDGAAVEAFFAAERPEYVVLAAAKVGGISANHRLRADFIYENLAIQNSVIHAAWKYGVKKLLFLGSTCIYPREAPQPMPESCLLSGPLEYTNEPYALAKIAGLRMCESYNLQYGTNFLAVMPTNLYGPNDNFDLENSHVLPALLRKMHLGRCLETANEKALRADLQRRPVEGVDGSSPLCDIRTVLSKYGIQLLTNGSVVVEIWGSGTPLREFLWSHDMADACVYLMERVNFSDLSGTNPGTGFGTGNPAAHLPEVRNCHINLGTGQEITIANLARLAADTAGFTGALRFNPAKPDGTLRKLTDVTKLHSLGWRHKVELEEGMKRLYTWYLDSALVLW